MGAYFQNLYKIMTNLMVLGLIIGVKDDIIDITQIPMVQIAIYIKLLINENATMLLT